MTWRMQKEKGEQAGVMPSSKYAPIMSMETKFIVAVMSPVIKSLHEVLVNEWKTKNYYGRINFWSQLLIKETHERS